MRLKLLSTDAARHAWAAGGSTARSVNTNASMVAMSGAIMPLPLAMPATWAPVPATGADAPLGNVSVVPMALAAASQALESEAMSPAVSAGSAASTRSTGRSSAMTPVEATSTSWAAAPSAPATDSAVCWAAAYPDWPVKALAFPELTITARPRPPLDASACRHQSTGAAVHSDRVKTPATVLPGGNSASIRSSRLW